MKTETEFRELLEEAISEKLEDFGYTYSDFGVASFNEAGVMTYNEGVVVDVKGNKFQVTIVKVN